MSKINDGGPAFPSTHPHGKEDGMTMRDYFAAKAMMLSMPDWTTIEIARRAYVMADAMLKAREEGGAA